MLTLMLLYCILTYTTSYYRTGLAGPPGDLLLRFHHCNES